MKIIWHDHITNNKVALFYQHIKKLVNIFISICNFYQGQPIMARKVIK